jgi:hypothetical protein
MCRENDQRATYTTTYSKHVLSRCIVVKFETERALLSWNTLDIGGVLRSQIGELFHPVNKRINPRIGLIEFVSTIRTQEIKPPGEKEKKKRGSFLRTCAQGVPFDITKH